MSESTAASRARIKAGVRLPGDGDSMGWLWLYSEALSGEHGPWWLAVAEGHTPSGRTDGTSWRSWRDDALAADVTANADEPAHYPCCNEHCACPSDEPPGHLEPCPAGCQTPPASADAGGAA